MKYYFPFIMTPIAYLLVDTKAKFWIAFFLALNGLIHYITIEAMSKIISIPARVRDEFKEEEERYRIASGDIIYPIEDDDIKYIPEILNKTMKITYLICITFFIAGNILLIKILAQNTFFTRQ